MTLISLKEQLTILLESLNQTINTHIIANSAEYYAFDTIGRMLEILINSLRD